MNAYLLEKTCALGNLSDNVRIEEGLDKNHDGLVLGLDTQVLGLLVNVKVFDLVNASGLRSLLQNPVAEFVIDGGTAGLTILLLIGALQDELVAELSWELVLTSLDGLLRHVDSPIIIVDCLGRIQVLGSSIDLTSELVVASASIRLVFAVLVGAVLRFIVTASVAVLAILQTQLLGSAGSLALSLGSLGLLALLGLGLQDEVDQVGVDKGLAASTAGLAIFADDIILDGEVGLGVAAVVAEDVLLNEDEQRLLQSLAIVGAVDDPAVIRGIHVGLSTKIKSEPLDDVTSRAGKGLSDSAQVDNNGLDTVALAFNLD